MADPKFKVGDMLVSKAQMVAMRHAGKDSAYTFRLVVWQVIEVHTVTCYAASQHTYVCGGATCQGVCDNLHHFNKVELQPAPTEATN